MVSRRGEVDAREVQALEHLGVQAGRVELSPDRVQVDSAELVGREPVRPLEVELRHVEPVGFRSSCRSDKGRVTVNVDEPDPAAPADAHREHLNLDHVRGMRYVRGLL